jgi:hypothetical protein
VRLKPIETVLAAIPVFLVNKEKRFFEENADFAKKTCAFNSARVLLCV